MDNAEPPGIGGTPHFLIACHYEELEESKVEKAIGIAGNSSQTETSPLDYPMLMDPGSPMEMNFEIEMEQEHEHVFTKGGVSLERGTTEPCFPAASGDALFGENKASCSDILEEHPMDEKSVRTDYLELCHEGVLTELKEMAGRSSYENAGCKENYEGAATACFNDTQPRDGMERHLAGISSDAGGAAFNHPDKDVDFNYSRSSEFTIEQASEALQRENKMVPDVFEHSITTAGQANESKQAHEVGDGSTCLEKCVHSSTSSDVNKDSEVKVLTISDMHTQVSHASGFDTENTLPVLDGKSVQPVATVASVSQENMVTSKSDVQHKEPKDADKFGDGSSSVKLDSEKCIHVHIAEAAADIENRAQSFTPTDVMEGSEVKTLDTSDVHLQVSHTSGIDAANHLQVEVSKSVEPIDTSSGSGSQLGMIDTSKSFVQSQEHEGAHTAGGGLCPVGLKCMHHASELAESQSAARVSSQDKIAESSALIDANIDSESNILDMADVHMQSSHVSGLDEENHLNADNWKSVQPVDTSDLLRQDTAEDSKELVLNQCTGGDNLCETVEGQSTENAGKDMIKLGSSVLLTEVVGVLGRSQVGCGKIDSPYKDSDCTHERELNNLDGPLADASDLVVQDNSDKSQASELDKMGTRGENLLDSVEGQSTEITGKDMNIQGSSVLVIEDVRVLGHSQVGFVKTDGSHKNSDCSYGTEIKSLDRPFADGSDLVVQDNSDKSQASEIDKNSNVKHTSRERAQSDSQLNQHIVGQESFSIEACKPEKHMEREPKSGKLGVAGSAEEHDISEVEDMRILDGLGDGGNLTMQISASADAKDMSDGLDSCSIQKTSKSPPTNSAIQSEGTTSLNLLCQAAVGESWQHQQECSNTFSAVMTGQSGSYDPAGHTDDLSDKPNSEKEVSERVADSILEHETSISLCADQGDSKLGRGADLLDKQVVDLHSGRFEYAGGRQDAGTFSSVENSMHSESRSDDNQLTINVHDAKTTSSVDERSFLDKVGQISNTVSGLGGEGSSKCLESPEDGRISESKFLHSEEPDSQFSPLLAKDDILHGQYECSTGVSLKEANDSISNEMSKDDANHMLMEKSRPDNLKDVAFQAAQSSAEVGLLIEPTSQMIKGDSSVDKRVEKQSSKARKDGASYVVGDLVWAKVRSHPWWPGQIFDASSASKSAKKLERSGRLLVAFFGDCTFAWLHQSQMVAFQPNFKEKVKQTSMKSFCNAVAEALDEVCRRAELGLSCQHYKGVLHSSGTFPDSNAGIQKGVRINCHKDTLLTKETFKPERILDFIKRVASFPFGPWSSSIEASKLRGHAYGVRTYMVASETLKSNDDLQTLLIDLPGAGVISKLKRRFSSSETASSGTSTGDVKEPKRVKVDDVLGVRKISEAEGWPEVGKSLQTLPQKKTEGWPEVGKSFQISPEKKTNESIGSGINALHSKAPVSPHSKDVIESVKSKRSLVAKEPEGNKKFKRVHGSGSDIDLRRAGRGKGTDIKTNADDDLETLSSIAGRSKFLKKTMKGNIHDKTGEAGFQGKANKQENAETGKFASTRRQKSAQENFEHLGLDVDLSSEKRTEHVRTSITDPYALTDKDAGVVSALDSVPSEAKEISQDVNELADDEKQLLKSVKSSAWVREDKLKGDKHLSKEDCKSQPRLASNQEDYRTVPSHAENKEDYRAISSHVEKCKDVVENVRSMGLSRRGFVRKPAKFAKLGDCIKKIAGELTGTPTSAAKLVEESAGRKAVSVVSMKLGLKKERIEHPKSLKEEKLPFIECAGGSSSPPLGRLLHQLQVLARDPLNKANIQRTSSPTRVAFLRFRDMVFQKSSGYGTAAPSSDEQSAEKVDDHGNNDWPYDVEVLAAKKHPGPEKVAGTGKKTAVQETAVQAARKRKFGGDQEDVLKNVKKRVIFEGHYASKSPASNEKLSEQRQYKETHLKHHSSSRKLDSSLSTAKSPNDLIKERVASEPPLGLLMKFPQSFALPSEAQLKATFVRFGSLQTSGIRVYKNNASAQVVFKHGRDAKVALKFAKENAIFGQAAVTYRLRDIPQTQVRDTKQVPQNEKASLSSRGDSKAFVQRPVEQLPSVGRTDPGRTGVIVDSVSSPRHPNAAPKAGSCTSISEPTAVESATGDIQDQMMKLLRQVSVIVGSSSSTPSPK